MSQLECSNALDGVLVSAAREGDAARSHPGRGLAEQTRRAPWVQGTRVSGAAATLPSHPPARTSHITRGVWAPPPQARTQESSESSGDPRRGDVCCPEQPSPQQ